jgi:hypothetical protein
MGKGIVLTTVGTKREKQEQESNRVEQSLEMARPTLIIEIGRLHHTSGLLWNHIHFPRPTLIKNRICCPAAIQFAGNF